MGSMQGRYGALQRMVTQGDVILVHPIVTSGRQRPSQGAPKAEPEPSPVQSAATPPAEPEGDLSGSGWPRAEVNAPGIVQWSGSEQGEQESEPTYQVAPPGYAIEFGTGRLVPINRYGMRNS